MTQTIYLDYAATTPVDPRVAETLQQYLTPDGIFGNPASRSHAVGWQAEAAVEQARARVAGLIGADSREIVWTSGATESDNLAIKGAAMANQARGRHLVTSVIEHKAVVDCFHWLEERGFEVTWLEPDGCGCIAADQVQAALRDDTILVSLMAVNNELGSINPIAAIGSLLREWGVLFHVDAAQALGKMALDVTRMPVDLMALSAHKVYGPKGIGALYVRRSPDVTIEAQMHGGGHERGLRSGTLATHQIAAMGHAFSLALEEGGAEAERLEALRSRFIRGLEGLDGVQVHGPEAERVPGIINIGFEGVDGESLLLALRGIAVSSGSACASATTEPSYVLRGIGLPPEKAQGSLRFSLGRFSTETEIDTAAERITEAVQRLRERSAARRATV
ncbi:aminotransferase class V-fold PLP-dependent enzyme [Vreelandella utahensis]|uniref:aminotransferase class V-fold PLP-dependent enzyme n=1 Tax=Vreelandella halophila TaxID=86177 RepID=UPI000986B0F1|nr:aminotransferase class V-fold PLP-dependent enzyme [Halomonas utahensis]